MLVALNYTFRSAVLEGDLHDLAFLCELYASTRREEMALSGWPEDQIEDFLKQQFQAQHVFYQEHFRHACFDLILDGSGRPIGRLYLEETGKEFRIIDIALLPDSRRKGIGGDIMKELIARASKVGKSITIHVEQNNPAMSLYLRLGFQKKEERGLYDFMELATSDRA